MPLRPSWLTLVGDKTAGSAFPAAASPPVVARRPAPTVPGSGPLTARAVAERHWRSLRAAGGIPRRSAIDPDALGAALPMCFVGEAVAPGMIRLRVAGQALTDIAGMDVRGMPLSVLFAATSRAALAAAVTRCLGHPAIVDLPLDGPRDVLRRTRPGRLLLMPLSDEAGGITKIIGVVEMDPAQGGRLSGQMTLPDAGVRRTEGLRGMAAPPPRTPGSYLRLVVSNPAT